MSENDPPDADSLRLRAEALERQLQEAMATHQAAMVRAELKAEAVRAGMVDLDGLKLVDPSMYASTRRERLRVRRCDAEAAPYQAMAVWRAAFLVSRNGTAGAAAPGTARN